MYLCTKFVNLHHYAHNDCKAVQRIPSAKCNGDMKAALEEATKCQAQENELLMQLGVSALNI